MAPVNLRFVVSYSSQDSKYPVQNLLRNGEPKRWLCAQGNKSGSLDATFQLDKECMISAIHIGNYGSSFIELSVGRSDWPTDQEYSTLMPTSSLMPPRDAKLWERVETVKMIKKADFNTGVSDQSWDRLRVRCSQPLRRDKQFGLTFLRVHTPDEIKKEPDRAMEIVNGAECLKRRYMEMTGAKREDIVISSPGPRDLPRTEKVTNLIAAPSTSGISSPARDVSRTEEKAGNMATPQNAGKLCAKTPDSERKVGNSFYGELETFLRELNVELILQDDDLQVSDLRKKLEKKLKRELNKSEKKLFRTRAPEYVQDVIDRHERKAKRRKSAAKLELEFESPVPTVKNKALESKLKETVESKKPATEPKKPTPKTKKQLNDDWLSFDEVFGDDDPFTPKPKKAKTKTTPGSGGRMRKRPCSIGSFFPEEKTRTPGRSFLSKDRASSASKSSHVTPTRDKSPPNYDGGQSFDTSYSIPKKGKKSTPGNSSVDREFEPSPEHSHRNSNNKENKTTLGGSYMDRMFKWTPGTYGGESPECSTSSRRISDSNFEKREKRPAPDYSSSGGFFSSDAVMERLGQAGTPSRGKKRSRELDHMPPVPSVVCLGETPSPSARRVVPPVKGRRIKDASKPDSLTDVRVHPTCIPVTAQNKGYRLGGEARQECPLCNERFPTSIIEEHAATCDGLPDIASTSTRDAGVIIDDDDDDDDDDAVTITKTVHQVRCPICGLKFSGSEIEAHADQCLDSGGSARPIML